MARRTLLEIIARDREKPVASNPVNQNAISLFHCSLDGRYVRQAVAMMVVTFPAVIVMMRTFRELLEDKTTRKVMAPTILVALADVSAGV